MMERCQEIYSLWKHFFFRDEERGLRVVSTLIFPSEGARSMRLKGTLALPQRDKAARFRPRSSSLSVGNRARSAFIRPSSVHTPRLFVFRNHACSVLKVFRTSAPFKLNAL